MRHIPGFGSSGEVWDGVVAHYQERFECHVLTLSGFAGASGSGESTVMPLVREQIAAYVAAHHLDAPVVVGHSMGGVIALSLAAEHPEAVGQLVVVDALPFLPAVNDPSATPSSLNEMALGFRNMLMSQPLDQRRAYQRRVLPTLISDPAKVEVALDWAMKSEGRTLGQVFYEMMTTDLRPTLGRIHAPVLVMGIWAGTPGATRAGAEQSFHSQYAGLSSARIVLADRARHFIMWDDPRWLMQLPAAAASGEEEAPSAGAATVGSCGRRQRAPRLDWAGLLRRTFAGDVFSCPRCGGQRRVQAYLTQGAVIRRILRHLKLPEQPPRLAPALGPAQQALWE